MLINDTVFKEYDLRGIADVDLTNEVAHRIGLAIGTYFRRNGEFCAIVCQDVRDSSPRIAENIKEALKKTGLRVIDIGVYPTPVCYFAGHRLGITASVMITASHNPPEYNGMKITSKGLTIHGTQILEIKKLAIEGDFDYHNGGSIEAYDAIENDYIEYLCENIKLMRSLKIAIDAGNGCSGPIAERLYKALGCDVEPLYCVPDPSYPNHHPDPTIPNNLEDIRSLVIEKGLDCGIAFDGDGDRLGVVDEKGNIIWGDMLQILFWREILPKYPSAKAIIEVKCSKALVNEVEKLGGKPFYYKTGHSLIKSKMQEDGLVFAGEMSGHMFFADEYFGFDDALYAGARLIRLLSKNKLSLSGLLNGISQYYATPEIRLDCREEEKDKLMASVSEHFKESGYEIIDIDGVRVNFEDGWGLLRKSNTQPVIVMRAEAESQEGLELIKEELYFALKEAKEE